MVLGDSRTGFRVHEGQPVAVQIKQVVIGSARRPGLVVDAAIALTNRGYASIGVGPGCETVETIRVQAGVDNDYRVFE